MFYEQTVTIILDIFKFILISKTCRITLTFNFLSFDMFVT